MILNWSFDTIIMFLSIFPIGAAFIISSYQYYRNRYQVSFFFSLGWFWAIFWNLFYALSELFILDPSSAAQIFYAIGSFCFYPIGFMIVFMTDYISGHSVNSFKIAVVTGFTIPIAFNRINIVPIDPSFYILYEFMYMLYIGMLLLYYFVRIHLNTPESIKKYSKLALLGSLFLCILSTLGGLLFGLGAMMGLFGIGALIISIVILKEPKLLFVLPFKVSRLAVIDRSGLPFFTFDWRSSQDFVDEALFSGMLIGISGILQESLNRGNIREIHLEEAILILKTTDQFPIVLVLVTSNSSRILLDALEMFTKRFISEYSQHLDSSIVNKVVFQQASQLVNECFPFIPEY